MLPFVAPAVAVAAAVAAAGDTAADGVPFNDATPIMGLCGDVIGDVSDLKSLPRRPPGADAVDKMGLAGADDGGDITVLNRAMGGTCVGVMVSG